MAASISSGNDLLSGVQSLGRRGRPRSLVREEALQVALDLVNTEGLGALTLRRLATELDVGTATVHTTFGGKEQLLHALADTVFGQLPDTESLATADPEDALVDYLTEVHRMLVGQPAIAQLTVLRRMHNPNLFRAHETIYELLERLGVTDQDAYDAYDMLTNYVFGFSLNRIARQDFDRREAISDLPDERFRMVKTVGLHFDHREPEEQLRVGLHRMIRSATRES